MDEKQYYSHLFYLQSAAREICNQHRVCACCRISVPGRDVEIWRDEERRRAKFRNVVRCGSVWVCPVCANSISARRRVELQNAISVWSKKSIPVMVSFTVRHDKRDELGDTLRTITEAWRDMTSCRQWQTEKKQRGLKGYVRALEVTWGNRNGWHPHLHGLFFLSPEMCIAGFYRNMREWWRDCVTEAGGSSKWEYACALTVSDNSIAEYITKWGHEPETKTLERLSRWSKAQEMTRVVSKHGQGEHLTPFDFLQAYMSDNTSGAAYWGHLYRKYATATWGQRQLTWSRGLREDISNLDDTEQVERIDGYALLAIISANDWRAIIDRDERGTILDCAARGDVAMMRDIIRDCRVERLHK